VPSLLVEVGVLLSFCLRWPQTVFLPITFQVTGITGMSHHHPACFSICFVCLGGLWVSSPSSFLEKTPYNPTMAWFHSCSPTAQLCVTDLQLFCLDAFVCSLNSNGGSTYS
jgi:hypothetical protein